MFAATKLHLKPDHMVVIAVWDRKQIEAPIGAVKLGSIGHRAPDGKPVGLVESRQD